jgi:hypothetical protein
MSKHDEQHWKPLVLEWSESNLSPSVYCKAKGIHRHHIAYARNRRNTRRDGSVPHERCQLLIPLSQHSGRLKSK